MQQVVRTTTALARAAHPAPALTVTALAGALAAVLGGPWPLTALVVLCGQLSVGWLNDSVDADRDAAAGRAEKPVAAGELPQPVIRVAIAVAAVLAVVFSAFLGTASFVAHMVALVSAWAYDLGVKATVLSVAPYAVSFGLLPLVAGPAPLWVCAAAAVLGCAAHFANAVPDIDDDLAAGVRGLPHRLGARGAVAAAAVLVLATGALLALVDPLALVGLAVSGAVLAVGVARGEAFRAVLAVALVDVVVAAFLLR